MVVVGVVVTRVVVVGVVAVVLQIVVRRSCGCRWFEFVVIGVVVVVVRIVVRSSCGCSGSNYSRRSCGGTSCSRLSLWLQEIVVHVGVLVARVVVVRIVVVELGSLHEL